MKIAQIINKRTIGTTFLILILIWLFRDIYQQMKYNKDIDTNLYRLTAVVVDEYSLSNRTTYVLEYQLNGILYKSSRSRSGGKFRHKIGDSVCVEISIKKPTNMRFCEY